MTSVSADAALAAGLAGAAGRMLVALRAEMGFADPRRLRKEGDRRAHEFIARALAEQRPADALLSEEGSDDPGRLTAERVWIVDPLDGTWEFGEPGRTDWAVHVALWAATDAGSAAGPAGPSRGASDPAGIPGRTGADSDRAYLVTGPRDVRDAPPGELVAGAVALPAAGLVFCSDPPPVVAAPVPGPPRVVASRSRAPALVDDVTAALTGRKFTLGSAGAKVMAVLRGQAEVYVHAGGQYEWDSAAPVAVAVAAGLHASRIDGSPLIYNARDLLVPDLLVCRPEFTRTVLAVTARGAGRSQ